MRYITTLIAVAICLCATATLQAQSQDSTTYRVTEYVNNINPKDPARMTSTGIVIAGRPSTARAMSRLSANANGARPLAECANYYKQALGDSVNIYVAAIPLAAAYYIPNVAKSWSKSHAAALNAMYAALSKDVKIVDVYTVLSNHTAEYIYSRTDHHWAPLGGYYAAEEFAKVAGVPFKDLSHYKEMVVPRYVGSMYQFTNDNAILASPERFVFHKPNQIEYTTTYIRFRTDNQRIVGETKPYTDKFFFDYMGPGAYCSFMGGDTKITQVRTATKNGRRLVIIKDSFGNVLPGYLFYSFEEIHVIDFRYFNKSMKRYVKEHGITDLLIATNISFACSTNVMYKYKRHVIQ